MKPGLLAFKMLVGKWHFEKVDSKELHEEEETKDNED